MREITLFGDKHVTIVDDDMYELLSQLKWVYHIGKRDLSGYARGYVPLHLRSALNNKSNVLMHRVVLGVLSHMVPVDHINGNKLDNRRENLRLVTAKQNIVNRPAGRNNLSTGYKGVSFVRDKHGHRKWCIARITIDGVRKYLGVFQSPELAAIAYNQAGTQYHYKNEVV